MASIAFDAASHGGVIGGSSPLTVSHTCTGSNLVLIVILAVAGTNAEHVSGVTYNGVALTQIGRHAFSGNGDNHEAWYLVAPATGTHNIVVTFDTASCAAYNASYTGASQTGVPDSFSAANVSGAAANFGQNVVTVADNCWGIWYAENGGNYYGSPNGSFNTGATERYISVSGDGTGITGGFGDSNGALTPAGTFSGTASRTNGNANWQGFTMSIAPALPSVTLTEGLIGTDAVSKSTARILLDGLIGTDIKTAIKILAITLTENLIGTDTVRRLLNGSDVLWTHITKSAAAVWTHITKS